MCQKIEQPTIEDLEHLFHVDEKWGVGNINNNVHTPGDNVIGIVEGFDHRKYLTAFRYGFFGHNNGAIYNARIETVNVRSLWRLPFKTNRCVIPLKGFWEHGIYHDSFNGEIMYAAAIWIRDKNRIAQCAILTRQGFEDEPNRYPAIMPIDMIGPWISKEIQDATDMQYMLMKYRQLARS